MKRVAAGVATGLLGVVLATAAAHAIWGDSSRLDDEIVTAGDLAVTAVWTPSAPAWGPLFPNTSTADAVLRVTGTGGGTTLGWRLSVTSSVASAFAPYVQFSARTGGCSGTPIPPGGYPASGVLAPGAAVDVCVRYTLAADAPGTLQGASLSPVITVTANQVSG